MKQREDKQKRLGRINDAFGAMKKIRDLEAKYQRDKDSGDKKHPWKIFARKGDMNNRK